MRRTQLRKDDFDKHEFSEGRRGCSGHHEQETTLKHEGAEGNQKLEKTKWANEVAKNTRERMETEETKGKRVRRDGGQKEDDVTKDASR